jgi:DNA-directed RNA polymerase beta subunit
VALEFNKKKRRNIMAIVSTVLSSVPFYRNTDGNRLQMASNHITQALAIESPELPYIISCETPQIKNGLFILRAPFCMKIVDIVKNTVILYTTDNSKEIRTMIVPFYHDIYVKPGDQLDPGQLISKYRNIDTENNPLIGRNCNVIFNYWDGFTFEDAAVANATIKTSFTGYTPSYIQIEFPPYKKIEFVQSLSREYLDANILYKVYIDKFYPDLDHVEILDTRFKIKFILAYVPQEKEAQDTYNMQFEKTKKILNMYDITKNDLLNVQYRDKVEYIFKNIFKANKNIQMIIYGEKVHDGVSKGDKFTNRFGNKFVVSMIVDDMPGVNIGKVIDYVPDFVLNPEGIRRMNLSQLGEMHYSFALKYVVPVVIEKLREKGKNDDDILKLVFEKFVAPLGNKTYTMNYQIYNSLGSSSEILDYICINGMRVFVTNEQNQLKSIYQITKFMESINIPQYIVLQNKLCTYGCMYILRLHHTSRSKISHKQQRVGEQEVWSLAQTAPEFLQELFIRSDDRLGTEKLLKEVSLSTVTGQPTQVSSFDILSTPHTISELKSLLFALNIDNIK